MLSAAAKICAEQSVIEISSSWVGWPFNKSTTIDPEFNRVIALHDRHTFRKYERRQIGKSHYLFIQEARENGSKDAHE